LSSFCCTLEPPRGPSLSSGRRATSRGRRGGGGAGRGGALPGRGVDARLQCHLRTKLLCQRRRRGGALRGPAASAPSSRRAHLRVWPRRRALARRPLARGGRGRGRGRGGRGQAPFLQAGVALRGAVGPGESEPSLRRIKELSGESEPLLGRIKKVSGERGAAGQPRGHSARSGAALGGAARRGVGASRRRGGGGGAAPGRAGAARGAGRRANFLSRMSRPMLGGGCLPGPISTG
jgi:hypothetical protein